MSSWSPAALLRPPKNLADPNARRLASLVHWLLLICQISMVLFLMVSFLQGTPRTHRGGTVAILAAFILLHLLLHAGRVRFAAGGLVLVGWLATAATAVFARGIESPTLAALLILNVVAAFIWRGYAALWMGLLNVATLLVVYGIGAADALPAPVFHYDAEMFLMSRMTHVVMTAVILQYAMLHFQSAQTTADREARRAWAELRSREAAEGRVRQSQKMEAVGQLAGGIAHDINNLLTVIRGNLEVLRVSRDPEVTRESLGAAVEAIGRGRDLTNRLLAFSRKQPLQPEVIDPADLVRSLRDLLQRTLGEGIEVQVQAAPTTWPCLVDRNELENALLNLVLNARDAMPGGGTVQILTRNLDVSDSWAMGAEVPPGRYVVLEVRDHGVGMDPEAASKAFEPFFTTKPTGQGTGLGLSMVYGFIKQSGGHVELDTRPGKGTSVRLYLPRSEASPLPKQAAVSGPHPVAHERILVVEDDHQVRKVALRILQTLGFETLEAADAASALAVLGRENVDLLFTDVVLPGELSGPQLARIAQSRWPDLAVVFTSGYAHDALLRKGELPAGVVLLKKPYSPEELHDELVRALSRPRRRSTPVPARATAS